MKLYVLATDIRCLFGGTYRRNWEGDYHYSRKEVKAMLRELTEEPKFVQRRRSKDKRSE